MSESDTQPQRRGEKPAGNGAPDLRKDEAEIVDLMRRIADQDRPGLLVAYFNGSNWMLYDTAQPRWLSKW